MESMGQVYQQMREMYSNNVRYVLGIGALVALMVSPGCGWRHERIKLNNLGTRMGSAEERLQYLENQRSNITAELTGFYGRRTAKTQKEVRQLKEGVGNNTSTLDDVLRFMRENLGYQK